MGVNLVSVKYNNEFRSGQDLPFLTSCIGEVIIIETEFFYEDVTVFYSTDNFAVFNPSTLIGTTTDTDNTIYTSLQNFFENTAVGDELTFHNTFDDFTCIVLDKISDQAVRIQVTSGTFPSIPDVIISLGSLANTTLRKGIRMFYNLVDVGSSFNSLIDGEQQAFKIATVDYLSNTPQPLEATGTLPYQLNDVACDVYGLDGSANYQQRFKLVHKTRVTPLFLLNQYEELLNGIAPNEMWFGSRCLNYINKIQLFKDLGNPNSGLILTNPTVKSNVGWFNENFNGGVTKYKLDSLVITRVSDSTVWDDLQVDNEMKVEIVISNSDLPFSLGNTKAVFGFNILPDEESQYQFNGRSQDVNFCIDSKLITEGAGFVNGSKFGTDRQIIKEVKCDKVGNDLKVTAVISVGTGCKEVIEATLFQRYNFWVITENHFLTASLSDKTNVLCQVSRFYKQLTTIDLIDNETKFVKHSYSDFVDGVDLLDAFPTDDISVQSNFSIDFTGRELENISIQAVINTIKITHATESDIILDQFISNTANFPIIGQQAQNIDFKQDRVFKVQESEKKTIQIFRDFANDVGSIRQYKCIFPFMHRWEYWVKLLNIDDQPDGIFDSLQPLNGINHFWNRLANVSGWTLKYELSFEIEQNGELFGQTFTKDFNSFDYDSNPDWTLNSIKTFDIDTNLELNFGGNKLIQGYKDTKVICNFTKTTGMLPNINDISIRMWIETFEKGGISDIRRTSTDYVNFNTFFKLPVTKSNIGNLYIGESLFDFTKLPNVKKFTVYARIEEKNGAIEDTFYIINEVPEILEDGLGNRMIYLQ